MDEHEISLTELLPGEKARVTELKKTGPMRRRLQDLGFIEGSLLECIGRSPGGDPAAYLIKSALIALRDEDGREVLVRRCREV